MKLSERLREYAKKSITIYHAQGLFESFAAEAAALERTQAEPIVFSKTPPQESGWYWMRKINESGWTGIVYLRHSRREIDFLDKKICVDEMPAWEFSQKIKVPEDGPGQKIHDGLWDNTISRPPTMADIEAVRKQFQEIAAMTGKPVELAFQVRVTALIETWIARADKMLAALVEIRDEARNISAATQIASKALESVADARPKKFDEIWQPFEKAKDWPEGTLFFHRWPSDIFPGIRFGYGVPRIKRAQFLPGEFDARSTFAKIEDFERLDATYGK